MLKAVLNCVSSTKDAKFGNHATFYSNTITGDSIQYFTYHGNIICRVNWTRKEVLLTNAGYNTRSTNRALNDYKQYFTQNHPTFTITDEREKTN